MIGEWIDKVTYPQFPAMNDAELDYEDVIPKREAIFERRLSREDDEAYAHRLSSKWPCVIVRITPVHIASFDYAKG